MPLDEKWSFIATGIYKAMSEHAKEVTFAMPMFSEWQMATHNFVMKNLPEHWNVATFGSIVKAKEVYKTALANKQDIIIIGNMSPEYEFDAIFNFQDAVEDLPYEDKYVAKLKEVFKNDEVLSRALEFYDAAASKFTLHDINAAAQFLSEYLETDPHLDEVKERYKDTLNFKNEHSA